MRETKGYRDKVERDLMLVDLSGEVVHMAFLSTHIPSGSSC